MKCNLYESRQYLNEYLLFHYGSSDLICPFSFAPKNGFQFHREIVRLLRPFRLKRPTLGLDLGCAVGRLTFELGRVVDHARGVDTSHKFIQAAQRMASKREMNIRVKEEGEIYSTHRVCLAKELRASKVSFRVGDAENLNKFSRNSFDVVMAINLLDRISHPRDFLKHVSSLLVPGGQLVIGSPYTWMEEYTSPSRWLGGVRRKGRDCWSSQVLRSSLEKDFKFILRRDLPFLIREHRRKYQWNVSEILVFRKRLR